MPIGKKDLRGALVKILENADLSVVSLKVVREKLSEPPFNFDEDEVLSLKGDIKLMVNAILEELQAKGPMKPTRAASPPKPAIRPPRTASPPSSSSGTAMKKRKISKDNVSMSHKAFFDAAVKTVDVDFKQLGTTLNDALAVREFSTGSCGWYGNSKGFVKVGDRDVKVQAQLTLICIGSKEWPKDDN